MILHIFKSGKASATASSHIHFGTNSDWYIRSGNPNNGKVIIQDMGTGIIQCGTGTTNTIDKLQVFGSANFSSTVLVSSLTAYNNIYNWENWY